MYGLEQCAARDMFYASARNTAAHVTSACGLGAIVGEGAEVDDYMFEPCGYSMNALAKGGGYYSVHVTPQDPGSFASFETNHVPSHLSYPELLAAVLRIFSPTRFALSLTCTSPVADKRDGKQADRLLLVRAQRRLCERLEERFGPICAQGSHRDAVRPCPLALAPCVKPCPPPQHPLSKIYGAIMPTFCLSHPRCLTALISHSNSQHGFPSTPCSCRMIRCAIVSHRRSKIREFVLTVLRSGYDGAGGLRGDDGVRAAAAVRRAGTTMS